jgi:pimeloyl-ACP methyl ester carboxylesterase
VETYTAAMWEAEVGGMGVPDPPDEVERAEPVAGIHWDSALVNGHRVRYAVTGSGPPALFLHGWGLRPNAYRRPIKAMSEAGCRVYAPALPGFGGTRELPADQRTFAGYAAWVGKFLDAVDEDEMALVAGHSFGGGVATAFVYDQPWRASALLLANAIGSPTWALFPNEVRTMVQRPVWDWGRHLSTDLLNSPGLLRLVPTLLEDFIPNLLQNPLGMFRTGEFAR